MSDTPRSDSQLHFIPNSTGGSHVVVKADFARTLERELNAERAAREQAEARLLEVSDIIGRGSSLKGWLEITSVLFCTAPLPILMERDALRVEYESRALWIAEMNKILGYDNSDGFHSEPSPHDLARQLVAELAALKSENATFKEWDEKLHTCLAAATGSAVSVHYREGGKFDSLTASAVRKLASNYAALKLKLEVAYRTAGFFASVIKCKEPWTTACDEALAQLNSAVCPRCGTRSQQEADDGKCDGTGCNRSDQPQCASWLGEFETRGQTCREYRLAIGDDQGKAMGIPMSDELLDDWIKRRDGAP